jgi:choline dehydrogenase-like flavoprotein
MCPVRAGRVELIQTPTMFEDFREFDTNSNIDTDVCIIGAGAAGITLAKALANSSLDVCLLESGGTTPEVEIQSLGLPQAWKGDYISLGCRMRLFGGSTSHWAGWSLPFDPIDFATRDWVEHSGWPIELDELQPWYRLANDIIGLGEFAYKAEQLSSVAKQIPPMEMNSLLNMFWRIPTDATGFASFHRETLESAPNVRVITYATVTSLQAESGGRSVNSATIASLAGNTASINARYFVIAAGAIESARLLLVSNDVHKKGLGNEHDNVGRYFMMHPHATIGTAANVSPNYAPYLRRFDNDNAYVTTGVGPTAAAQEQQRMLNCSVRFEAGLDTSSGFYAANQVVDELKLLYNGWKIGVKDLELSDDFTDNFWTAIKDIDSVIAGYNSQEDDSNDYKDWNGGQVNLVAQSEQAPNRSSRVILGDERNALGMLQIIQDCRLLEIDRHTLQITAELIGRELGAAAAGRVQVADWVTTEDFEWPRGLWGGCHQIGTTRMSTNPRDGVVDQNQRLHGVNNVFVASSGVFPTGGYANPTMTSIALTFRLAEHLKNLGANTLQT